jgi:hypothetical protein
MIMTICAVAALTVGEAKPATRLDRIVDAIAHVETGGIPERMRDRAVGDGGRSRGRYQVGRAAWTDARVGWPYSPYNAKRARTVLVRYCQRYAGPFRGTRADIARWARTWNGGPKGPRKRATVKYAAKVWTRYVGRKPQVRRCRTGARRSPPGR